MKVYQLRLILGKATNYDQNGKLKNQTVTSKYAGEMELEIILTDQNWRKLGACEISCVGVFDTETKSQDAEMVKTINDRINSDVQTGIKPKTEIELLKEQIALLNEKVSNAVPIPVIPEKEIVIQGAKNLGETLPTEKEIRNKLFEEATELGLKPAKNVKTAILKDLIANAKKVKA